MRFNHWYIVFLFVAIGCGRLLPNEYSDDIFTIGEKCTFISQNEDGLRKGKGKCGKIAIYYEYGKDVNPGPLTESEEFYFAFRGNYYARFFEIVHIEAKLNRYFIDSVTIKEIRPIDQIANQQLFHCVACNRSAYLNFRNKYYWFPFYSANDNDKYFDIKSDTIDGCFRKIYISKSDSLSSGIYFATPENYNDSYKLNIMTEPGNNRAYVSKLFKTVRIKCKR